MVKLGLILTLVPIGVVFGFIGYHYGMREVFEVLGIIMLIFSLLTGLIILGETWVRK